MSIHAVLFDLDGTLLDTLADIALSANSCLREWGLPVHENIVYRAYLGDGLSNLARKVLPETHRSEEHINRFIIRYREIYAELWNSTSAPFLGIPELLRELCARGIRLAVLSNKRNDFTQLCIREYFPDIAFEVVRGELPGVPLKPDPTAALQIAAEMGLSVESCAYVGDSEIDIETAVRSGMLAVGVTWGFRDPPALHGAAHVISAPHELLACL